MKKLILVLVTVLFSHAAIAQIQFDEQRVTFQELTSLHKIRCVIPLGRHTPVEQRMYTDLGNRIPINVDHQIEIDHDDAPVIQGCNIEALDQLVENAMKGQFGFVTATYTVIKKTAKEPRLLDGKCVRNYDEQILVDIGEGFVLSTQELGILKPAMGCQP